MKIYSVGNTVCIFTDMAAVEASISHYILLLLFCPVECLSTNVAVLTELCNLV
jgi:hypothetical protein